MEKSEVKPSLSVMLKYLGPKNRDFSETHVIKNDVKYEISGDKIVGASTVCGRGVYGEYEDHYEPLYDYVLMITRQYLEETIMDELINGKLKELINQKMGCDSIG